MVMFQSETSPSESSGLLIPKENPQRFLMKIMTKNGY